MYKENSTLQQTLHTTQQQVQVIGQQVQDLQRVHGIEQQMHELQQQMQVMREQSETIVHRMQEGQEQSLAVEQQMHQLQQHVLTVGDQVQVLPGGPTNSPTGAGQGAQEFHASIAAHTDPSTLASAGSAWNYRLPRRLGKVFLSPN